MRLTLRIAGLKLGEEAIGRSAFCPIQI